MNSFKQLLNSAQCIVVNISESYCKPFEQCRAVSLVCIKWFVEVTLPFHLKLLLLQGLHDHNTFLNNPCHRHLVRSQYLLNSLLLRRANSASILATVCLLVCLLKALKHVLISLYELLKDWFLASRCHFYLFIFYKLYLKEYLYHSFCFLIF